MAVNYVLLEKITVGAAGATEVTFSSIPQTGYTDLKVVVSARDNNGSNWGGGYIRFNGDTTSGNYNGRQLYGNGSTASSASGSGSWGTNYMLGGRANGGTSTASTFGNSEFYIPNYTSGTFKSITVDDATESNATAALSEIVSGVWLSTAAITSITVLTPGATYQQGSTFYLYGIAKLGTTPAIYPQATGGDIIETDGTYWYHAFLSSGTFTPAKGLTCDVLAVAGGGGLKEYIGGGGGAGGVSYLTSNSVVTAQTVTIGAGGSTGNGSNSQFGSLTAAVGGGAGGNYNAVTGNSGGSGGGGGSGGPSGTNGAPVAGGSATSGQGNAGGAGVISGAGIYNGGGGGGAGAVGANAVLNTSAGNGGAGTNTYSSWLSVVGLGVSGFIAGGGGGAADSGGTGGVGGSGGGGAGGVSRGATGGAGNANGVAGTANTGGGSGSFAVGGTRQSGGSGLVIVRYAV